MAIELHPEYRRIIHPDSRLVLVRGLPGSGKTTWATQLARDAYDNPESGQIQTFCNDDFFTDDKGVYKYSQDIWDYASRLCKMNTAKALYHGKVAIVHNVFVTTKAMDEYIAMARLMECSTTIITMNTQFKSVHNVPDMVMDSMRKKIVPWETLQFELRQAGRNVDAMRSMSLRSTSLHVY